MRALVEHRDAVGDGVRLFLVVGDEDRGDTELALQLRAAPAHLDAQLGVEIRQRLVEQQHFGLDHERARERDALLLAAGELRRPAVGERAEADQLERRGDLARRSRRAAISRRPRARRRRSSPPSCAATARSSGTPCRRCASTAAARVTSRSPIRMRPVVGVAEAGDQAQQRGLAGARRPEEGEELAAARHRG